MPAGSFVFRNKGNLHIGDTYYCEGSLNFKNGEVTCTGGRLFKNGKLVRSGTDSTTDKEAKIVTRNMSLNLGRHYSLSVDNKSRGSYEIPDSFVPGVEVRGHDSDMTEIEMSVLSDKPEKVQPHIEQQNNSLSVSNHYTDDEASGFVSYSLKVPEEVQIAFIKTNLGRIVLENLAKEVGEISTGSGNIDIKNIRNNLRKISTLSGRVAVENIKGDVNRIRTTSGNIVARNITGTINAESLSGKIKIDQIGGDVKCDTTSGNISIDKVQGNVTGESLSGRINCEGIGGYANLSTTSGNIDVRNVVGKLIAGSMSGTIRHCMGKFQKSVQAKTMSGRCYFNGITQGKSFTLSNNEPTAQFSTTSGNIHIN